MNENKFTKKKIAIISLIVAALVSVITVLCVCLSDEDEGKTRISGAENFNEVLETYSEGIGNYDFEKMISVFPVSIQQDKESREELEEDFRKSFENIKNCSYTIKEKHEFGGTQLEEQKDSLERRLEKETGIECTLNITEMYVTTVELVYEFEDSNENTTSEMMYTVYKCDDAWYIYNFVGQYYVGG